MIEILQNLNEYEVYVITPVFNIPDPVVIKYDGSKKKVVPTLVIKPAGPVPYVSDKAVSYHYNVVMLEDGKEVPLPSTSIVSISDVSIVTRSGRAFSAQPKSHEDVVKRDVVNPAGPVGTSSSNHSIPAVKGVDPVIVKADKAPILVGQYGILREDGDEMLRLIKRSEYNVVEQLLQTPSKISILYLLMNLEPHREALQRVLDVAYVDHDVTIEQFDNIVANITACNNLSFCGDDLPEEGKDHNLALHISMNSKDDALSNVLVDTRSSLNVLPKSILAKLSYQRPPMRQNGVVVKAFDGSRKSMIGELDLPIKIGPSDFQITFQVMDIHLSYNCLLGRPWIHEAGAVTSTLHQKLKFVKNKKLVVIGGENALLVSHLSSFSYIDAEDESGGFIHTNEDQEAAAIIEEDEEEDLSKFVIPGGICNNWVAVGVPTVIHKSTLIKLIEHNDPTPSPNFEFLVFEAEEDDVEEIPDEFTRLLEYEEKIIQPHLENLETVNLGSEDCIREVNIGALLGESVKKGLIELLRGYVDVFAWSYEDMPGLDSDIVQHFLSLKPECVPVKQKLKRTHPGMAVKIKEEVQKQIDAGFLVTSTYPQCVANIVPVPKKDGKVRMCVDYRDLNKASPKDDFPLPHIDMLVDNTAKSNVFSFMDGFSGYNQIKMTPEDMEKTTLITP
ncbi:hypothetical protein KIW84_023922 [Lathyrus oleraceus]|uniref:Reverse transcriptase domain-containing protein n=1 Tax=Pisum sativum TaxID=3888 RepID=A0A9D4YG91_PEA|nr:hypothetical protein KIW84_023922 [Pisum sativum]